MNSDDPPISVDRVITIAADALPRAEFRAAVLAAVRTDPEIREAIRFAAAAGRHIE